MSDSRDYLPMIFRRCVLAIAGARIPGDATLDRAMLEQLVLLSEQRLTQLGAHMQRLASAQRRTRPAMEDLALMLHFNHLNVVDLEAEVALTPRMEASSSVATLNGLHFDMEEAPIDLPSRPFFEHHAQLMQSTRLALPCSAPWMPALPPDHTYMHSPSHSSTVRDLRHVRLQLVEEGRLAEKALQRMLGDRGSASVIEIGKTKEKRKRAEPEVVFESSMTEITPFDGQIMAATLETPKTRTPVPLETPEQSETRETSVAADEVAVETPQILMGSETPVLATDALEIPAPEISAAPKGLKLKLSVPSKPAAVAAAPPFSLKLSLAKQKKQKKDNGVLGKRPKVDIEQLAHQQPTLESEEELDKDLFERALASVR